LVHSAAYPDDTFGSESRIGIAFTFLLRDILQFDLTVDDSINRITTAKRTCSLILGVGDGKLNQFRSFQYSSSDANVIDDVNLIPKNDTWHAPIKNVVYHGMDWLCPPFSEALMIQLNKHWGNITAENAVRNIVPLASTGTLQVAVYDLTAMQLYLSYARKSNNTEGPEMAYDRPYVQVNLKMLFAEPKP
jgi:isopenicillin-N N-acyltransferase-like protein